MSIPEISLTLDSIEQLAWEDIISDSIARECSDYSSQFFEHAKGLEAAGNLEVSGFFVLLGAITSFHLKLDDSDQPFHPFFVIPTGRTASVDDLNDTHLAVLDLLVDDIADPELQARVSDLLWICRRDYRRAELAVNAYLAAAAVLEDPLHWPACMHRIERALQIGSLLGRNQAPRLRILETIEEILGRYNGEDPLFLSARLMELLLEQRHGDPNRYAALAEKAAQKAEQERHWHRARNYWQIAAQWHRRRNDESQARNAQINAAETHALEADEVLHRDPPDHGLAAIHLQGTITALRRIGGMGERVDEIHRAMLGHQQVSVASMQASEQSIDLSDAIEQARGRVRGKSAFEALVALVKMGGAPNVDKLRAEVQHQIDAHPLLYIFPARMLNAAGKTIGQRGARSPNDDENLEELLRAEMLRHAVLHREIFVAAGIEPDRQQIWQEHPLRPHDFFELASYSSFVPPGREWIYARGLYAGLQGDFLVATHLLFPQFEHSIRWILHERGVVVSRLNDQGIQDELDLNRLLYLPEMASIFGEDVVFDLKGLLVERFGANLRNTAAHGLIEHSGFYSAQSIYFWWLVLRLMLIPIIARQQAEASNAAPSASSAAAPPSQNGSGETNSHPEGTR
ncbi:DUF4209 domain-containing protein [Candidatus Chloroploca sp. M-50]|uniref:DUF4209 domain-containing protein n=1 Tax=Candidatus Chloroploca mongolica TaxID=2528176 RepID=A0ABS4D9W6_9CHLR|nr:DUF4209 domain-containing protein [Candidatus Chloroploca mongolica]MBP1466240.1 DUF4209 domain-containing protein [Candidatus Chloroploca mongolica]